MGKKISVSNLSTYESIGYLRNLNDTIAERNVRIRDKYIKSLFLYYKNSDDTKKIILSYLLWEIEIGDLLDIKDFDGKWYVSVVLKRKPGQIFIHYIGWAHTWNEWVSISHMELIGTKTEGNFYYNPYSLFTKNNNGDPIIWTDMLIDKCEDILLKKYKNTTIYAHQNGKITSGKIVQSTNYELTYYDFNHKETKEISTFQINSVIIQDDLHFIFVTID